MRQFVYISTATPDVTQDDVEKILASSQRNNPARNITGFLIFNGRNFLQLLEGEESSLSELMAQLATDPRHDGVVRLEDSEISERSCAKWAMMKIRLLDSVEARRGDLEALLPDTLSPAVKRTVLNFAALN